MGVFEIKSIENMDQLDLFGQAKERNQRNTQVDQLTKINNGEYLYLPDFFSKLQADGFLVDLKSTIEWKQEAMNMYGKRINFPRLTAWYGDQDKPYSFSGIKLCPLQWTESLLKIKMKIEPQSNVTFNSVLLNLYRNGNDSISWHTDAEPELGVNPVIASVNFGATRTFQLRHRDTMEKIEINLTHGSLLIMQGELQHYWKHQVPKTRKDVGERINLTFRVIK